MTALSLRQIAKGFRQRGVKRAETVRAMVFCTPCDLAKERNSESAVALHLMATGAFRASAIAACLDDVTKQLRAMNRQIARAQSRRRTSEKHSGAAGTRA